MNIIYRIDKNKFYLGMLVNLTMKIMMSKSLNYKREKEVEKEEGRKGKKEVGVGSGREGRREQKQKIERSFIFKFYQSLM